MKKISPNEVKNFTFTVVCYLLLGLLLAWLSIPGYIIGVLLAFWSLAVFSFEFKLQNFKLAIGDTLRIGLGLILAYFILKGLPYVTQILKYYLLTLLLVFGFWLSYKMCQTKAEQLQKILDDSIKGGEL